MTKKLSLGILLLVIALCFVFVFSVSAQPRGERRGGPRGPQRPDTTQVAKRMAQHLQKTLNLTDKQTQEIEAANLELIQKGGKVMGPKRMPPMNRRPGQFGPKGQFGPEGQFGPAPMGPRMNQGGCNCMKQQPMDGMKQRPDMGPKEMGPEGPKGMRPEGPDSTFTKRPQLTDAQKAKIKTLNDQIRTLQMERMKVINPKMAQRMEDAKAAREAYDKKLQQILTKDQYKQYTEMIQKNRKAKPMAKPEAKRK